MDQLQQFLTDWAHSKPELDLAPLAVLGRVTRLMSAFEQVRDEALAPFELKYGEFDVLATLRRQGAPYQLTPSVLYRSLLLSSGAISKRLDRLETAGLVTRTPDPQDKRGWLVSLTVAGLDKTEIALAAHTAAQQKLLAMISVDEQQMLAGILSGWLYQIENQ